MNVSELSRKLHIHPRILLETLPLYGFDIGKKAVKIDDKVAAQIMKQWNRIKRDLEEKERKELEEKKRKEKELRRESGEIVKIPALLTVREFADRLHLPVTQVIMELMKNGILANQNQNIDQATASIIAEELGFRVEMDEGQAQADQKKKHEATAEALETALARGTQLERRAPVIVVMGHVDHGKTKLLDTIRHTNIIDKEAGGITQHIGAYQTVWKDPKTKEERALTFIDTPGHEAFTVMRSRGATVADIAILVVAADDGVKPQTEEVIQIIRAAKLPFVVAINKVDKEAADVQRVKTELSQRNIIPEDWGGDVPMVEISAKQNVNIDKLLDVLLLVADLHAEEIKADPHLPAIGTIIESHKDKNIGPIATVLIQAGTLKKNDPLVVNGEIYGKVRAMRDYMGKDLDEASLSVPVQIIGFKVAPEVGDILDVHKASESQKIDVRQKRLQQTGAEQHVIVSSGGTEEEEGAKKALNVVVKSDVLGSLEAIIGSLEKIRHEEVNVKVIGKGLGNITDDDVNKAGAGNAVVIGFHVKPTGNAEEKMRDEKITFRYFDIIYDLTDWVKDELEKLLEAEKIVTELGIMRVKALFRSEKNAMTVGGLVEQGKMHEGARVRVKRNGELLGYGKIASCQIGKGAVKEIPESTEGGIRYEGKVKIEKNDTLEAYTEESKVRKIVFESTRIT